MDNNVATTYDTVPYQSHAFAQTQPDKLAVIARLFGLDPILPSTARVLELGCASGGNLIPLAARYPKAHFVGIDLSAVEVAHGREQIAELGLRNIRIEQQSLVDFSSDERFDYIIVHGVYSWVPVAVQEAIMSLCAGHLSDAGIAYVSYNVYPGWKGREVVRDAMLFHAGVHADPKVKVEQARGFIQFLEKNSDAQSAFGTMLREEAKLIAQAPDYYLFHDHLEENNRPCYFREFIAQAQRHGLGFLGEAAISEMAPQRLGAEVAQMLQKLSNGNILATEQYMDFVKNRMFRQTLLVKQAALKRVTRNLSLDKLLPFYVSSPVQREQPGTPIVNATDQPAGTQEIAANTTVRTEEEVFTLGKQMRLNVTNPYIKLFMAELMAQFPKPIGLRQLQAKVLAAVPACQIVQTALDDDLSTNRLAPNLLNEFNDLIVRMAIDGLLSLHIEPFEVGRASAATPRAFPVAFNLVRQKQLRVPNLRHESVSLSTVEAEVLSLMDGKNSRAQLIEGILLKSASGVIRVERDKQPVHDEEQLRPLLENLLTQTLHKFERCALLS